MRDRVLLIYDIILKCRQQLPPDDGLTAGGCMDAALKWLITIESRAEQIYRNASMALANDAEFAQFLLKLSRDEHTHEEVMIKVAALISFGEQIEQTVTLAAQTRESINLKFEECERLISSCTLTAELMAAFLEQTECSEWNAFYLFVLNTVIREHKEFIPYAVEIQRHKKRIERFLDERGHDNKQFKKLKELKALWNEQLLVVDDEPFILDLLSAFLEDEGSVACASNGAQALEKLSRKYYAVIICDIDMPVMNGMEFFEKAVAAYPNINRRFLFHTGALDAKRMEFFTKHNLAYIQKPADLRKVRAAISAIIDS